MIRAEVAETPDGRSRGFGTVQFASNQDAVAAIEMFNGYDWDGRVLEVRQDLKPENRRTNGSNTANSRFAGGSNQNYRGRTNRSFIPELIQAEKLYVGNIPFATTREELTELFSEAGTAVNVDIPLDANDRVRGFALITMGSLEEARNAAAKFSQYELNGRRIEVREDEKKDWQSKSKQQRSYNDKETHEDGFAQVFVSNLPFSYQWQDLKDFFRDQDFNPIKADVFIYRDTGRSKGCGIVRFATREEAENALELDGTELKGRPISIKLDRDM